MLTCGDLLLTMLKKNYWVCLTWALYAVSCRNLKAMFPAKTVPAVEQTMPTLGLEGKLGESVWGLSHLSKTNSSVLWTIAFLAVLLLVFATRMRIIQLYPHLECRYLNLTCGINKLYPEWVYMQALFQQRWKLLRNGNIILCPFINLCDVLNVMVKLNP